LLCGGVVFGCCSVCWCCPLCNCSCLGGLCFGVVVWVDVVVCAGDFGIFAESDIKIAESARKTAKKRRTGKKRANLETLNMKDFAKFAIEFNYIRVAKSRF